MEAKQSGSNSNSTSARAYFAAGCFWKVQYIFSKVPGVLHTTVGYMGGSTHNPTYEQVCTHTTGHAEAVEVVYDPHKVSYDALLDVFFSKHDPTTMNRQGPDVGTNYRSAIFCATPEQKAQALQFKEKLEKEHKFKSPIVTQIEPASTFYSAEEYHQNYYEKHGAVCY
jgi:peptide-methionine (S)-S-oxide reductase